MKYIIILMFAAICILTPISYVDAVDDSVSIDVATSYDSDELISDVTIVSNSGLWCISIPVSYDDRMELLGVADGIMPLTSGPNSNNPYILYGENDEIENLKSTGTLAKMRFKAPASASDLWISIGESEAFNANGKSVSVSAPEGRIYLNVPYEPTGVILDKSSLKLTVWESYTLSVTVLPSNATDKSVRWESSNASVATVSGGKIVAISEGEAVITATTVNGKEAACSVTVKKAPETVVSVTGVTLDKTSVVLDKGSSTTLTATVLPANATDKEVVWSTSDSKVATVSNGKVTATGPGDATITVTTSDGGRTATCRITVLDSDVKVTSVSLDKANLNLSKGDTAKLTTTVLPANASNKGVIWSTSDSGIATVSSDGTVKAVSPGTTTIKATTSDGGLIATCNVIVEEPSPSNDNTLLYVGIAAAIIIAIIAALALRKR